MKPNSFWENIFQNRSQSYLNNNTVFKTFRNFSSGENALSLPSNILGVFKNTKIEDLQTIPDIKCQKIKERISQIFHITPEMISVGNGSDEIIENIPRVFLEPHEFILTIAPTFFRFIEASRKMKGNVLTVFTTPEEKFRFTKNVIDKALTVILEHQPKIIWLCSPNNPTGAVMTSDQINRLVRASNNLVVIDEAFHEFIDPENKKTAVSLLKEHKNLLVLKTFSKSWGVSGIRFGFAIGHPKIIKILEQWRLPFNINALSGKVVLTLLNDINHLKFISEKTKENREKLFKEIKRLPDFEIGADSKTNIFILKHRKKDLFQELIRKGILTADLRNVVGLEGKKFVRITLHDRKKNLILLKALRKIDNSSH